MVTIRCKHCDKEVEVGATPSPQAQCPACGSLLAAPAGPQPPPAARQTESQTAGGPVPAVRQTAGQAPSQPAPWRAELAPQEARAGGLMALLPAILPWAVSILLHLGVLLILAMAVAIATQSTVVQAVPPPPEDTEFISAEAPGGALQTGAPSAGAPGLQMKGSNARDRREWSSDRPAGAPDKRWALGEASGTGPGGGSKGSLDAYGFGGGAGGGGGGDFGLAGGGGTGKARFFGTGTGGGGSAYYVIFIIDGSGSVVETFDDIKEEMKDSIFKLTDVQQFHVVFFANDAAVEIPPAHLVQANEENKRRAVKFIKEVQAFGFGSSPIPALQAAFKAFQKTKDNRGKVLFILTDGEFDSSGFQFKEADGSALVGNKAVIAWLRANNKDKAVHVYPIILHSQNVKPLAASIEEDMKTIATENGGDYKYVER